jgi:hypothetical protein
VRLLTIHEWFAVCVRSFRFFLLAGCSGGDGGATFSIVPAPIATAIPRERTMQSTFKHVILIVQEIARSTTSSAVSWAPKRAQTPRTRVCSRAPQPTRSLLGYRLALCVFRISPYVKHDYVSHTIYETASLTRFVEGVVSLSRLGWRDATANRPTDMFDFTQTVKPLMQERTTKSIRDFHLQRLLGVAPDDD